MGCCDTENKKVAVKQRGVVNVDFLYLDESVCVPCSGTGEALDEALAAVRKPLELMGVDVELKKIHVADRQMAVAEKFVSSPTIRVGGVDIDPAITQADCPSCGTLAGDEISVDCRTWHWRGEQYQSAPVGKIIEDIMQAGIAISGDCCGSSCCGDEEVEVLKAGQDDFALPGNLDRFFKARESANPPSC